MSKLPGLSLISRDLDNLNKEVKFLNINDTNADEPIFITGTATDIYENNGTTINSSVINNIGHGKFSRLSLINNNLDSVDDSPDIQKGEANYIYVEIETGQLKTNSFSDFFENNILNTQKSLVLKDSNNETVTLTGDDLKKLNLLIKNIRV